MKTVIIMALRSFRAACPNTKGHTRTAFLPQNPQSIVTLKQTPGDWTRDLPDNHSKYLGFDIGGQGRGCLAAVPQRLRVERRDLG